MNHLIWNIIHKNKKKDRTFMNVHKKERLKIKFMTYETTKTSGILWT